MGYPLLSALRLGQASNQRKGTNVMAQTTYAATKLAFQVKISNPKGRYQTHIVVEIGDWSWTALCKGIYRQQQAEALARKEPHRFTPDAFNVPELAEVIASLSL